MSEIAEAKAALRREIRSRTAAISPGQRAEAVGRFFQRAVAWSIWREARTVLLTWSLPDELSATGLIETALRDGKRIALPVFDAASGGYLARQVRVPGSDLVVGRFGVREPRPECPVVPLAALDLVLVPGIAFSPVGGRLGRGKGYYDRLLSATCAVSCGVGFDEQIIPGLPMEPHDVRLNFVLTPTRLIVGAAVRGADR